MNILIQNANKYIHAYYTKTQYFFLFQDSLDPSRSFQALISNIVINVIIYFTVYISS